MDTSKITSGDIKDVRVALSLTQDAMGDLIFTPRVSIARWETGTVEPGAYAEVVYTPLKHILKDQKTPSSKVLMALQGSRDRVELVRRLYKELGG